MTSYASVNNLPSFDLWEKLNKKRLPLGFDLEITARCNNDCRHCYINLHAGDNEAKSKELGLDEINEIAKQASALGAIWVLITGGEPLLRKDFTDIYLLLKKKGFLVSVFTNACPVTSEHIQLFKKYPPRDIEITVYGVTKETYEKVSRIPGSYKAFRKGLDLFLENGIPVSLKAMAMRSNVEELKDIAEFCRKYSKDAFRFDPQLHLRYDGDRDRNLEIMAERLSPHEIASLDRMDPLRLAAVQKECQQAVSTDSEHEHTCNHVFHCGAGKTSFSINYQGQFLLCASLQHPSTVYDLRQGGKILEGSLVDAWNNFVPRVLGIETTNKDFINNCLHCKYANLCFNCPANAYLENGEMDGRVPYFCRIAHTRSEEIENA